MGQLIPGERVLWRGRPAGRAGMRDVLHGRVIMGYFAIVLLWGFAADRADGWTPLDTLWRGAPVVAMALVVFGACALFASALCRTTTYELTTERCVLHYGVALTASLSIPLRRLASVGLHARGDGTGDVLLTPKVSLTARPGNRLSYVKLWPHARSWRWSRAEPMLRGVPHATALGHAISAAAAGVAPGVVHAASGAISGAASGSSAKPATAMPEPIWSPAAE